MPDGSRTPAGAHDPRIAEGHELARHGFREEQGEEHRTLPARDCHDARRTGLRGGQPIPGIASVERAAYGSSLVQRSSPQAAFQRAGALSATTAVRIWSCRDISATWISCGSAALES